MEVDEDDDVDLLAEAVAEGTGRGDGVASVGGDQRVRDRAAAAPAPPARLGVGGDADRPGDVGGPAVPGLDQPVVVPGREEEDLFAAGGVDDAADVGHHQRAPGQRAEVDGLQMGEEGVVALDQHHRLVRLDLVALVQGADPQLLPPRLPDVHALAPGAELQHRDRLIDPAQQPLLLGEDLHRHLGAAALGFKQPLGQREVGVGVVAAADFLDRQPEGLRRQPLPLVHLSPSRRGAHGSEGGGRWQCLPCARARRRRPRS